MYMESASWKSWYGCSSSRACPPPNLVSDRCWKSATPTARSCGAITAHLPPPSQVASVISPYGAMIVSWVAEKRADHTGGLGPAQAPKTPTAAISNVVRAALNLGAGERVSSMGREM